MMYQELEELELHLLAMEEKIWVSETINLFHQSVHMNLEVNSKEMSIKDSGLDAEDK